MEVEEDSMDIMDDAVFMSYAPRETTYNREGA